MIYKKYGRIFKKIRNQRRYPLSYFENVGISKSALAKFERGETMIGLDRATRALQEMGITLEEFEQLINDFTMDYYDEFLFEIEKADIAQKTEVLERLYIQAKTHGDYLLSLAVKGRLGVLETEDINEIVDTLTEIEYWGYFELSFFYFTMDDLSVKDIKKLMLDLFSVNTPGYRSFKYRHRLSQIGYRAIFIFTKRGYQEYARLFFDTCEPYHLEYDVSLTHHRELVIGFYIYKFIDREKGWKRINTILKIFEKTGEQELADYTKLRLGL